VSELNFGECIGCGLCILGCPSFEETGFDLLTARGRNKALQSGLAATDLIEPIWACTLCGFCDAICPSDVHNVAIVLHLRRQLARTVAPTLPVSRPLVVGCTIRERAPHLVPSIQEFLRRIGRPAGPVDDGCCGSLEVEAGRALPSRAKAGVVADPICLEQYDAEYLGSLAMQHLDQFDLSAPFYYYVPSRIVNGHHARSYPLYDALRRSTGCETNLDLNRLARATSAASVQGLSGENARDIRAAVERLLAHSNVERIVTCSPADYLAFKAYSGRDTRFVTECLR
jgi:ferredoxin